jgi:hypothetical protein
MRMLMARWASLVLVLMSHLHVNGHDYMEIRLIRLMSTSLRFCTKALGTGWDYGTAARWGIGSGWSPFGPLSF